MMFVPNSLTAAPPLMVHFSSVNLKPCHFSQPPHCSCKYRLLINSLSLQWQTAIFNSDWWKIYIITKLPLPSFCHLQNLPETWSPKAVAVLLLTGFKEWEEFVPDWSPHLSFLTFSQNLTNLALFQEQKTKERILPLISVSCFHCQ